MCLSPFVAFIHTLGPYFGSIETSLNILAIITTTITSIISFPSLNSISPPSLSHITQIPFLFSLSLSPLRQMYPIHPATDIHTRHSFIDPFFLSDTSIPPSISVMCTPYPPACLQIYTVCPEFLHSPPPLQISSQLALHLITTRLAPRGRHSSENSEGKGYQEAYVGLPKPNCTVSI